MILRRSCTAMGLFLATFALSGCWMGRGGSPFEDRSERPVRIEVENNNFLNVTIHYVVTSSPQRLGEVPGKSSETFTLDPRRSSVDRGLQLRVNPIGSNRTYLSDVVFPNGGDTVVLTVGANLWQSHVIVRR